MREQAKRMTLALLVSVCVLAAKAQGVMPLPTLHVEGKWLVDAHGNHVVLHGVMDTPNVYFNGDRWQGSEAQGWWDDYNDVGVANCLAYFDKIFKGLKQANCNVFRLHLDPAWTNDPGIQAKGDGSEADISRFNPARLRTFMTSLYWPLMKKAMDNGMYVVVRPPGVCPGDLKVGDTYQRYLQVVWNTVSSNSNVKNYAGQISLELANEPVALKNANGEEDPAALHDYFQPIVDRIRGNGFTGIIWVPGTGWQSNYTSYATHPIEGYNIGYAVHDYCGWYGCSDDTPNATNKIKQFHDQVPVVDTNPIIITEVDWSPVNPNAKGHYDEHGNWVQPNYGTWATGSTSKWGTAFKALLDHYGNISMTLSGTGCLIDIDALLQQQQVVPAFGGMEEACGKACMDWYADFYQKDWPHADSEVQNDDALTAVSLSLVDAQSAPTDNAEVLVGGGRTLQLLATFSDGHTRDVSSWVSYATPSADVVRVGHGQAYGLTTGTAPVTATYTDPKGNELTTSFRLRSTFFPFAASSINTSLFAQGTYTESTHTFRPGQWGQMGWVYSNGIDLSDYKYLVVKLKQTQTCNAHLNIFTTNSIWGDCYASPDFGSNKQIVIDLSTAKYTSGSKTGQSLATNDIRIVSLWGNGNGTIVVDDIYLTNNEDYSAPVPTAIEAPQAAAPAAMVNVYTLSGQLIRSQVARQQATQGLPSGIYLIEGKKVLVSSR